MARSEGHWSDTLLVASLVWLGAWAAIDVSFEGMSGKYIPVLLVPEAYAIGGVGVVAAILGHVSRGGIVETPARSSVG